MEDSSDVKEGRCLEVSMLIDILRTHKHKIEWQKAAMVARCELEFFLVHLL